MTFNVTVAGTLQMLQFEEFRPDCVLIIHSNVCPTMNTVSKSLDAEYTLLAITESMCTRALRAALRSEALITRADHD